MPLVIRFVLLLICLVGLPLAAAEDPTRDLSPGLVVPEAAKPGPTFNVDQATDAYVALLTAEQRAQSDAYFEGGYWLQLWGSLLTLGIAGLLLFGGVSRRIRQWSEKIGRGPFLQTMIYAALFLVLMFCLSLPWSIYTGYVREHQYGLATQGFSGWIGESLVGLAISVVIAAPMIALLYAAVRRAGAAWWAWAGGITVSGLLLIILIAPVFIAPLFNTYTAMPDGELRDSVLSMARAHQIPADDVYVFDASKQTTRISANVSGLLGTTRIALNDNLMDRTSDQEVRAVMGHEMGHYVLNHSVRLVVYFGLVLTLGYLFIHLCFDSALSRYGQRWGIVGRADPAGLPLAMALFTVYLTAATPVTNSVVRSAEAEADAFGLAVSGEPHGFATVAMRLSTYRKIHPGQWEEVLFYDHPSGYQRVYRSMRWLQENPDYPTLQQALESGRPLASP